MSETLTQPSASDQEPQIFSAEHPGELQDHLSPAEIEQLQARLDAEREQNEQKNKEHFDRLKKEYPNGIPEARRYPRSY